MITVGNRIGRLITVQSDGKARDKHKVWLCRCDCGAVVRRKTNVLQSAIRNGRQSSCGCAAGAASVRHGLRGTRTYDSWRSAIQRCHNPDSKDYENYGARGIAVCDQWRTSFEAFLADMGERPAGTTLDREDVDGHYAPGNCRWATAKVQANNRRRSVFTITWNGAQRPLADVAADLGISYGAAYQRHKRGKL